MNKIEYLTNAIKVINDLIENIPTKYLMAEQDELIILFGDVNKELVEKLSKEV